LILYDNAQEQTIYHTKVLVKKDDVEDDIQILKLLGKFLWLLSDDAVLKSHQQSFLYKVEDFTVNGEHVGILEMVKNSKNLEELLQIQKKQVAAGIHGDDECDDKIVENLTYDKLKRCYEFENTLVASAAFSSVAGFLLGINDRHWGNTLISLTPEPIYLHIDFGYIYGRVAHLELGFPLSLAFLNLLDDQAFKDFTLKMKQLYKELVNKIKVDELPEMAKDIFLKRSTLTNECTDVNEDEVWEMVIYNTMWRDTLNNLGKLSWWNPFKSLAGIALMAKKPGTDMDKLLCVFKSNGESNLKLQEYTNKIRTWYFGV